MCDYSVVASRSRLAVEGEELVTHRFLSGSIGLVSPQEREAPSHRPWWQFWRTFADEPCAVCVPPGARLMLWDVPVRLRDVLNLGPAELVTMVQTSMLEGQHRDGIHFRNHQQVLLQRLPEGQRLHVVSLACESAERRESEHMEPEHRTVVRHAGH